MKPANPSQVVPLQRLAAGRADQRAALHDNLLETIGHTPIVRINKLAPAGINLYAKLESFNPGGSVKDRLAVGIIETAERSGQLRPGQTVIEATSGNTGIGLAMVCAQKGYPLVIVMAENFSIERRTLMRFLGARVVLTPASEMGSGMLIKARELAEKHGWFYCRQFDNEANADIHSQTTAREIVDAFHDQRLDYWVSGYGTGGTVKGIARVLRRERPATRIVVAEPDNSPLLGSGITQSRQPHGITATHPAFRPHLMQGWTPDFISQLTEDAVTGQLIDQVVPVKGAEALRLSRELARQEGILTGITGGATLAGTLQLCESIPKGSTVLCMLPDTGERYLSTPLFESINIEMSDEEHAIADSTSSCRFSAPSSTPIDEPETTEIPIDSTAAAFVEEVLQSREQPVVMFALEWCEFCWSIRKLFARCGIAYRSVDLDSAEFQPDDWGGKVRTALNARTGWETIPQIFIGGEFIGGCTDTFDTFRDGRLAELLKRNGVAFDDHKQFDPYDLLPKWLHSR